MNKNILMIFYLFIFTVHINAQGNNAIDALSRMEDALQRTQEEFTPLDSYFLGRTVAAIILDRYPQWFDEPEKTEYLNLICMALVINSTMPLCYNGYHVTMLDDQVPNAFSTPGGHIFLSRGLINLAVSEDMLAAIIAHELAHIQMEHGIAEIKHNWLIQDLNNEQNRAFNLLTGELQQQIFTDSVSEITQTLFSKGYSQLQEFEADSKALLLLASAGYNPKSLIELLVVLEHTENNLPTGLNKSHPLPSQRIERVQNQTAGYRMTDNGYIREKRYMQIMGNNNN